VQALVVAGLLPVREQVQARLLLVLEHWLLCWMVRRLMVLRGEALNARLRMPVCRPGLLWVEPQVISRQRAAEGVVLHGLAQVWVPALRVQRLVLGEVEPVQQEAV